MSPCMTYVSQKSLCIHWLGHVGTTLGLTPLGHGRYVRFEADLGKSFGFIVVVVILLVLQQFA